MATVLLTLLLATSSAERCAAMLLSPNPELRKAGAAALENVDRDAVLRVLAEKAHSRTGWIAALEQELPDTEGPRHKEVRELLRILKGSTEDNVGVDLVLLSLPRAAATKILGEGLPRVVHEDAAAWGRWLAAAAKADGASVLFKTSLPGKDGLVAKVEKKRRISYLKAWDVDGNRMSTVVDELEAGLFLSWRPAVHADGRHVTLDLDLLERTVKQPFAVEKQDFGGRKLEVQVPEVNEAKKRVGVTLPLGGCAAFAFAATDETASVVILRARLGAPQGIPELPIPAR